MRIDLACTECGKNRFSLEQAESVASVIYCEDCGHQIGTLGEAKQRVALAVVRRAPAIR